MFIKPLFRRFFVGLILGLGFSLQVHAQDLPGSAVADTAVGTNAQTLISLAQQKYPDLFATGSTWRSFAGFFYKYFSTSGVYVGISGSDLYLMGGPFGSAPVKQGSIADAILFLQGSTSGTGTTGSTGTASFQNVVTASTLKDLLSYFRTITVAYGSVSQFGNLQSAVSLEAQGQETVSGKAAEKLIVTVSGNNIAAPVTYQMWVDSEGVVVKLLQNGFEFAFPMSNTIGTSLVSGMLLALKSAEAPAVQSALANELKNNSAVSQKTENRSISGIPVKTLSLQIGSAPSQITLEVSDFGPFSMATKMSSVLSGITTTFEIKDIVLR